MTSKPLERVTLVHQRAKCLNYFFTPILISQVGVAHLIIPSTAQERRWLCYPWICGGRFLKIDCNNVLTSWMLTAVHHMGGWGCSCSDCFPKAWWQVRMVSSTAQQVRVMRTFQVPCVKTNDVQVRHRTRPKQRQITVPEWCRLTSTAVLQRFNPLSLILALRSKLREPLPPSPEKAETFEFQRQRTVLCAEHMRQRQ